MCTVASGQGLLRPRVKGCPETNCSSHLRDRHLAAAILAVSASRRDRVALRRILRGIPCHIGAAGTCRQALKSLSRGRIAIVLCDQELPDGTWLDLLDRVSSSVDPPLLIVTSRLADDHLWSEVLHLGGFDVIAKPFRAPEVQYVVKTAWLHKHDPAPRHMVPLAPKAAAAAGAA